MCSGGARPSLGSNLANGRGKVQGRVRYHRGSPDRRTLATQAAQKAPTQGDRLARLGLRSAAVVLKRAPDRQSAPDFGGWHDVLADAWTSRSRARASALAACGLALAAAVSAEDATPAAPDADMEEVVVTASAAPQDRDTLTSSVSLMTAEEIEFQRYDNVTDLLRLAPGVHVEQPGSRGGRSSIYLRGLDPNQTVILVDGVRMGDPNNNLGGSFDLSTLDVDDVERIEIVRGPLSAVHGSDALAGAVQIITRDGRDGDALILDGSGGRFGYGRGLAIVRGQRGVFDGKVSGSFVDDGKPEADSTYRAGNLHLSLGAELPHDASLRGTLRFVDARSRAYPQASGGEEFAVGRDRDKRKSEELSLALALDQRLSESFNYHVGVDYYRRREKRDSPAIAPPAGAPPFAGVPAQSANDLLYRTRLNANATGRVFDILSLTAGGDVTFESGNSRGELDFFFGPTSTRYNDERVIGGPFVEANLETGFGLTAQAGVRADFSDEADTEWTPRVGASYRIPVIPILLRSSWGRGFKLPAFFSQSDALIGNPSLDAERSEGWDAGIEVRFFDGRILLTTTYFEIRVEDLIDFDFSTFQLVNRTEVTTKGVEIGLRAVLPWDLLFSGSVTRVKTNIKDVSEHLLHRPRWRASGDLQWRPHERVGVGLTAVWVGSVYDESFPTRRVKLDDHVRFDFRGDVRVWREVSLYLAIENLLDASYEEAVGVPAMGIRPRAGVRATF